MNRNNNLIILSGPVGAGKSTVAKEMVAASTTAACAYIEGDTFWPHLAKSGDLSGRHKNFRIIMRSMVAAAIAYAASGCESILDFSIPPWFIPTVCKMAGSREIIIDYVVLCPSEAVCATRALEREQGKIRDYEQYREFHAAFAEMKSHILDGDANSAAEAASLIRSQLSTGKFCIYPSAS